MHRVILVRLPEYEEGRYDVLEWVIDPDSEKPEDTLKKVREIITGMPLGVLKQPLTQMQAEIGTRIVNIDKPDKSSRRKLREPGYAFVTFGSFEKLVKQGRHPWWSW